MRTLNEVPGERELAILVLRVEKIEWRSAKLKIGAREVQVTNHPDFPQDFYIYGVRRYNGEIRVKGTIRKDRTVLV